MSERHTSAVVTPGNLRSALAVTRSLGRRGIPVTVADARVKNLAGVSRYCLGAIRVPSAETEGKAFAAAILEEVLRKGQPVIIPIDDVTLSLLAEVKSAFEGLALLPFPGAEVIHIAHDKGAVMALANQEGIPAPRTLLVNDPADFREAIREVGLPAVVKPRFSTFPRADQWIKGGRARYVRSHEELERAWHAVHNLVPSPLVQEYVPGEGRGVFLLMKHGEVRAAFAHRRIREKPPSGGVSVLSESIELDPRLLETSCRLLQPLKWHGVAMVEFKRDARNGVPKLLEINGRFWGSLQLAVDSGIDFPYLLYRLATDGDVEPAFSYRRGVRLRWWLGDVDWLLLRLRHDRGLKGRLGAAREFLRFCGKTTRSEVLRWDDPKPALEELSQYVAHMIR